MKKFKITKGDRVYIVDAKSHIDAISKVKAVKDSSIKDYSPEVYVKELEKLIPEYQRLGDLKSKIRESLVSSGKADKSKMGPDFKLILNDAKVQQWLKQVRELDKKWNKLLDNISRFGANVYKQQSNGSDLDVWLNSLPDSGTISDIKFDVKSKYRKYEDSISQWNPGMSEIGLFQISYKRNGVYQSILVRANSEEQAKQKLLNNLNGVDIIGVNSHPSPHFHEPILDSSIKDDSYYYLLRDAIDLLTKPGAARGWSQPYLDEVQEYMVQKGINPTNVNQWKKKYESLTKDSSIKDGWSGIRSNGVIFNYSDGKYTITHKNGKVETFPGNKFNTAEELFKYIDNIKDSKIKDIDEYKKNYAAAMRAAGEKTKRDQINSDIQKLYDIAKQYGPIRTEQNKLNNEFEHQDMQVVRNRFYNDPTVKRVLKQMEDLDTKWNAIVDKYKFWRHYRIPEEGPNRFMGWNTPTKKWVDEIKKQLIKDSAIKDSYGWSYIMAPMKTPGDKDLNLLSKLMSTYYDYIYQDVYNIRKAFAKTTNRSVAINKVKDTPEYQYYIKMLNMVDKDWNAVISKYPKLKKFNINTTGAERLLYGYYPTTKDFVDEITPVIKKEW